MIIEIREQFYNIAKEEKWLDEYLIEVYKYKHLNKTDNSFTCHYAPLTAGFVWKNTKKGHTYWEKHQSRADLLKVTNNYIVQIKVFLVIKDTILYNIEEKKCSY